MNGFGLARIGRDAELRKTQSGESVLSLSLAFSYGRKGDDGRRPTQWVDATMWGKRAEALAPYLQKGGLVSVTLEEVHIEVYQSKGVEGHKLAGRISGLELAGSKGGSAAAPAAAPRAAPAPRPAPAPSGGHGFEDMDEDIPF